MLALEQDVARSKIIRALRARIAAFGIRPTMRRTGLSQHTIEAVLNGRRVRRTTLRRLE